MDLQDSEKPFDVIDGSTPNLSGDMRSNCTADRERLRFRDAIVCPRIRQSDERSHAMLTALIFHRGIHRSSTDKVEFTSGSGHYLLLSQMVISQGGR
jgi:hypothetical protein